MSSNDHLPEPIFIGGSARSGTHAMGQLIAADPHYHLIPLEVRIHAAGSGLPDLLAGRASMDKFLRRVRGFWWERGARNHRGLKLIVERDELDAALDEFQAAFDADRLGASGRLVRRLLDPVADRAGKPYWAEVSGRNIGSSPTIHQLFPQAKFVHMFRDGRSVAASIVNKDSMTTDPMIALRHWNRRVRAADAAVRDVPSEKVLFMRLDDLTALDRDASFERLTRFIGVDDDAPMRAYFDAQVSSEAAHVGKWRERLPEDDARRIERVYGRVLRDLHRDGITWVPSPEEAGLPGRVWNPVPASWTLAKKRPEVVRSAIRTRTRRIVPARVRRSPVARAARSGVRRGASLARPVAARVRRTAGR